MRVKSYQPRTARWVFTLGALLAVAAAHGQTVQTVTTETKKSFFKIDQAEKRKYFVRFGGVYIKVKSHSDTVYDESRPIVSRSELEAMYLQKTAPPGVDPEVFKVTRSKIPAILADMDNDRTQVFGIPQQANGIFTPTGIGVRAHGDGSPTFSLGMYLDDDAYWGAEMFAIALPFKIRVTGTGGVDDVIAAKKNKPASSTGVGPNALANKQLASTDVLPPTFILTRYLTSRDSRLRPFVGFGVAYAIFYNAQATRTLEDIVAGPTDVKLKNAVGYGPFLGLQLNLDDRWHLFSQIGYIKLKTTGTIETRNTSAQALANSPIISSVSGYVGHRIRKELGDAPETIETILMDVQHMRGGSLGNFTRKVNARLDPIVFHFGVGYSF